MAESCVFGKQSLGPFRCGPPPLEELVLSRTRGHPFSRSCGAIMPSSLTTVPPIASVCSTRPPVSVLVRAPAEHRPRGFSRGHGCGAFVPGTSSRVSASEPRGLPCAAAYLLSRGRPEPRAPALPRHRSGLTRRGRYGNVRPLRIGYASRPRLSPRLTLGGLASPRKPWACGGGVSRAALATHASILAPLASHGRSPVPLHREGTLPYRRRKNLRPAASAPCLAPCIVGALPLDQ